MGAVYPRAAPVPADVPPFDEAQCAVELIALREARPTITKQLAANKIIYFTGGRVLDIYRVWDEIEAERLALEAVPLQAETTYIEAISTIAINIDPVLWVAGMQAKLGVAEITEPMVEEL